MSKRLRGNYDNFDSIRFRAKQMVENGEMTQEEASAWIKQQDALEYASVESEPLPEPVPRTSFPDQGHKLTTGSFKTGTGTIIEPEAPHKTKWGQEI